MGGVCNNCSGLERGVEPDIDEKKWKVHFRNNLLPSPDSENYPIHLSIIARDIKKLKKQLKKYNDNYYKINELDHHGYTPLHLAVLLKWTKGIDLLLLYYASPILCSTCGWTPLHEAISTKQFEIYEKLSNALTSNIDQYSKQNVIKLYKNLTQKTDFYIEIKLESYAKVLSGAVGHYFPSDVLKIWKKNGMVRIDMTLLEYDYEKNEWKRGNISNIFMIKQNGSFDFYYIDHDSQSIDLQPNKPLLNFDTVDFDIFNKSVRKKVLLKPVKSRRIEIKKAKYKRQKSWTGHVEQEIINGMKCSVYKATDIQFITKYRNEHIPISHRKHVKNDSNIVSLLMSADNEENDDDDDYKEYEFDDVKCDYIAPQITIEDYQKLKNGDGEIKENANSKYDKDESFIINTIETTQSETTYDVSIYMTDNFGIEMNEILDIFDLIGVQTSHMNNVKRILQLTAYDESRFPLCLEMPLLLNVIRAKITFQSLNRECIDNKIFAIPKYKR